MSELLFNPFDPAFRANPYPFYDRLRTEAPVYPTPFGFTVISRYEDVARTLRGAEFSRDVEQYGPEPIEPVRKARRERFRARLERGDTAKTILNLDPPDHTRLRRLVSQAFTPSAIERLRPRVQQLVDDAFRGARETGAIELVDEVAFPVPFQVISDMLALPTERGDEIRHWSQLITQSLEPISTEDDLDRAEVAIRLLGEYLLDVIEDRRSNLGDDVLSALIQAEEGGDRMSTQELLSFVILLYVAGHETTVNLIGNGALALLRNPSELRRWRDDPGLDARAIDELLRFDGPVQHTVRVPLVDVTYGDHTVAANTVVLTVLGAASHDPEVFDEPHTLRLDRANANRHLGFAGGIHYCLGASLAKLEAITALTTLIRDFDHIELAGEPRWRDRLTIRGIDHLPLTLTPR